MSYNNRGEENVIYQSNLLGGYDVTSMRRGYLGNITSKYCEHHSVAGVIKEQFDYTYDHHQRLVNESYTLNDKSMGNIIHNEYDALGRLAMSRQGSSSRLQRTYAYNVRSQLTSSASPLFTEKIYYESPRNSGVTPCFNGDISSVSWSEKTAIAKTSDMRHYDYSYDALDRLTNSSYSDYKNRTGFFDTDYIYDHQGNVRYVATASGAYKTMYQYYPFGGYFVDGMKYVHPYLYGGKEMEESNDLDEYDFEARNYDPALCRFNTMDPLSEKYYHLSPYSYCGGDPINRVDLHGDSITILDMASIDAIYNALQPGTNLSIKFNNGVLIPESIRQIALNSPDAFLQDLYTIATNPQMVELATTSTNDYYIGNQFFSNPWSSPSDIDYAKEFNNGQESLLYPLGKTIIGNLGQTLYPISSDEYKRSTNNNVRININAMGNINQRSCGIAHEFGHVILFLKGQPHSHSNNADYIYGRQWNVMRRLGYDYLESPTGTVFR